MTPTSRRLRLATGLEYHVLEWGAARAAAPVAVLLHGFLDHAWAWAEVAERLAEAGMRVVAPDWRGHGDSEWIGPGGYYHFMDYVADLDDVVAQVAPGEAVSVAAHSMGGSVAMYWAGVRPARCKALALVEGLGPPELPAVALPARTAMWIDAWKRTRGKPEKVMASIADAAARLRHHDPMLGETQALWLAERGTRGADGEHQGGVRWKHDPLHLTTGPYPFRIDVAHQFLAAITAPVLYVEGSASTFRLPSGEVDARLAYVKRASRAVVEGAGHAVARHRPAELAAVLHAHFSAPEPEPGGARTTAT
jgi:pimeloyl-ACP methyl ester carboxylesterase